MYRELSKEQAEESAAIAALGDDEIDLSDQPEVLDWTGAVRGRFYCPEKESITLELDADVLAWLKAQGGEYAARVNELGLLTRR